VNPPGPELGAVDATVGALARREGGTAVTDDSDLTHEETKAVIDIDEYRNRYRWFGWSIRDAVTGRRNSRAETTQERGPGPLIILISSEVRSR